MLFRKLFISLYETREAQIKNFSLLIVGIFFLCIIGFLILITTLFKGISIANWAGPLIIFSVIGFFAYNAGNSEKNNIESLDPEFKKLIDDYIFDIKRAHTYLNEYLKLEHSMNWRGLVPQTGKFGKKNEFEYYYHGIGCTFHFTKEDIINYDYGFEGRLNCFDPWKQKCYAEDRLHTYPIMSIEENFENNLKLAKANKEIIQKFKDKQDSLYYLKV